VSTVSTILSNTVTKQVPLNRPVTRSGIKHDDTRPRPGAVGLASPKYTDTEVDNPVRAVTASVLALVYLTAVRVQLAV
jgi:hypothetical protein